jgi:hypothetical protein
LFNECVSAFSRFELWKKAKELSYGTLTCLGRHTLTGMITACGKQFSDWSSIYRLFSHNRIDTSKIFEVAQRAVIEETSNNAEIIAQMDDTICKKTGRKVPGTAWRRDPLGPPFHTNFIWGQRFLQISLSLPENDEIGRSRAIPIDFHHCPTVKKPGKWADENDWYHYKEMKKKVKLSKQGCERIKVLRQKIDNMGKASKQILIGVDGSYTNAEVLKGLPEKVTLIGRIRKDTKLYSLPTDQSTKGRKRVYGDRLPTPEKIRQSDQYPWHEVIAWAVSRTHTFNVKVIKNVRWRSAGEKHNLMLVIIRPLGYRLTKASRILYREPAYLICTDTQLNIQKLIQAYLWRWEIEVNFHEEKSLLGCGQAQVRNPNSVQDVPAFTTALYSLLHIANYRASKTCDQKLLPRPKWYPQKENQRTTTGDLINNMRAQLWAKAIGINFSGFVNEQFRLRSLKNYSDPTKSAMFYMRN